MRYAYYYGGNAAGPPDPNFAEGRNAYVIADSLHAASEFKHRIIHIQKVLIMN